MPEAWEAGSGADCLGLKSFILVQAESYVPAALLGFKALTMEEQAHSEHSFAALKLYYQGAYTMRTEFSVLTGIDCRELGIYAYDPYLLARCCPVNSLAREFKSRGFSAICLHPHDRRFFARDEVISNLGFDFFIAGEDLENLEHHGPHVSDEALLSYAVKLTQNCGEKLFIFVITMEAHGPWLRGRFADKPDLTAGECYARHLKSLNAGVMKLCKAKLPCFIYGDHQPALPEKILHGAKPGVLGLNLPGKVNLSGFKDSLQPWELTAFIKNRLLGGAVHA